jgi:hypothetical protein
MFRGECYHCRKYGHSIAECRKRIKEEGNSGQNSKSTFVKKKVEEKRVEDIALVNPSIQHAIAPRSSAWGIPRGLPVFKVQVLVAQQELKR